MNKRIKVTANANLADIVMKHDLKINNAIRLGKGKSPTDKIIADAFEAFLGAIKYAEGMEKASEVILGIFVDEIEHFNPDSNYKGRLQEYVAQRKVGDLDYSYSGEGPDHQKIWTATVSLNDDKIAQGTASKQREAAMNAAREALQKLNVV